MLAEFGPQPMGAQGEAVMNEVQARVGGAHERAAAARQVLAAESRAPCSANTVPAGVLRPRTLARVFCRRVCLTCRCSSQAGVSAKVDALRQELEAGGTAVRQQRADGLVAEVHACT